MANDLNLDALERAGALEEEAAKKMYEPGVQGLALIHAKEAYRMAVLGHSFALRQNAPALIAAARTLKNLRDGQECDQMVLVPIRPTEAMLNAWTKDMADWEGVTNEDAQEVYRAMLSAHEKGTK